MNTREKVFAVVKDALSRLNEQLDYDSLREIEDATPIWGGLDGIDSLSLVSLAVDLEEQVEQTFGRRVVLTDEQAIAASGGPYRTAGSLSDYIAARLG